MSRRANDGSVHGAADTARGKRTASAANGYSADQIQVNIQALSGGPANNAVYHALVNIVITSYSIHYTKLYDFEEC